MEDFLMWIASIILIIIPIALCYFLIMKAGVFGSPLIIGGILFLLNYWYANFIYEHKQANDDIKIIFNQFISIILFIAYTIVWIAHRFVSRKVKTQ